MCLMAELVRPYRGISADARRALRRERLIDATLDLVGIDGIAGVTMKGVSAHAGLTQRYFYESFSSVDELLGVVVDRVLADIDTAVNAAIDASPPDLLERSRATIASLIDALTHDPRRARMYIEAAGSPSLRSRQTAALSANAALVATQMRELGRLQSVADERVQVAALVLVAGAERAIQGWVAGAVTIAHDDLVDEIAQMCVASATALRKSARPQ